MKRFFKWFFGILITLVILIAAAIAGLLYYVDPNEYKDELITQARPYMMGRDLQIPGDIKLSFFPWLGVEVGEIVIGNAEGFVLKPFLTVKQSRAHIKLLSLLSDTPEIGRLEFHGLVVNLQRDAEGRDNWSDLSKHAVHQRPSPYRKVSTQQPAAQGMSIPTLRVQGVHLKNATLNFEDRQAKSDITISKLELDAGPIEKLAPIPLKGQFNYNSKSQGLAAASAFATTLSIAPDTGLLTLQDFLINTNVAGEALNNKTIPTSLKIPQLEIDPAREKVTARPFFLTVDTMQSEGRLNLQRFSNPIVRLGLDMDELDVDKLLPAKKVEAQQTAAATAEGTGTDTSPAIFAALIPLKTSDLQGTLNFKKLKLMNLQFDNVKLNLLARGGLVSALPEAGIYGGSYRGDIQVTVKSLPVTVRTSHEFRDIPMLPVTQALTGKESLSGTATLQGQFLSEGNTLDELTRHLNGDAVFNIRNAELKLVDAEKLVLQDWYEKLRLDEKQDQDKEVTVFDSIRGTIRVKNGIAYNRDLSGVSRRVHLSGEGHANLVKQELDYTLYSIPKKSIAFSIGGSSYDLKDKKIPTRITGNWSSPHISTGLDDIIKADIKSGIKSELKESEAYQKKRAEEEKLKSKIEGEKDKLQDKLKNLLNR